MLVFATEFVWTMHTHTHTWNIRLSFCMFVLNALFWQYFEKNMGNFFILRLFQNEIHLWHRKFARMCSQIVYICISYRKMLPHNIWIDVTVSLIANERISTKKKRPKRNKRMTKKNTSKLLKLCIQNILIILYYILPICEIRDRLLICNRMHCNNNNTNHRHIYSDVL